MKKVIIYKGYTIRKVKHVGFCFHTKEGKYVCYNNLKGAKEGIDQDIERK